VPFIISEPVSDAWRQKAKAKPLNSHQLFDFTLNGVAA
jgi:hypothetical protein